MLLVEISIGTVNLGNFAIIHIVYNKAGQRLAEFCQENALIIANTLSQQDKRRLYVNTTRWSIPKSN